jgi:hypothetical protein
MACGIREFTEALTAIGRIRHFETNQMAEFIQNVAAQVEVACNISLVELKAMPDMIRKGNAPIPREEVAAPGSDTEAAVTPTIMVFMLKSARYRDHEGRQKFLGQWEDAITPIATAQKAIRLGIAVPTSDPRRAALRGSRGGDFRADAPDVVDIDAAVENSGVPYHGPDKSDVIAQANFIETHGPQRKGEISVQRF